MHDPVVFTHHQCGLEPLNFDGTNLGSCWWGHRTRRFSQRELSLPFVCRGGSSSKV